MLAWGLVYGMKRLDADFSHFLRLVEIGIWPITVLICAFFFRKVFTYLFFSVEEYNFFGIRGSLKSVTSVIEERARMLEEKRLMDEKLKTTKAEFEAEINMLSVQDKKKSARFRELTNNLLRRLSEVQERNIELEEKFKNLTVQKDSYVSSFDSGTYIIDDSKLTSEIVKDIDSSKKQS